MPPCSLAGDLDGAHDLVWCLLGHQMSRVIHHNRGRRTAEPCQGVRETLGGQERVMAAGHEPDGAPHLGERSCGKGRRRKARAHVTPDERSPIRKLSRKISAGAGHPAQQPRRGGLVAADQPVNGRREQGRADPESDQAGGGRARALRSTCRPGEQRGTAAERMADHDGTLEAERANDLAKPNAVGVAIVQDVTPLRVPAAPADPPQSRGAQARRERGA